MVPVNLGLYIQNHFSEITRNLATQHQKFRQPCSSPKKTLQNIGFKSYNLSVRVGHGLDTTHCIVQDLSDYTNRLYWQEGTVRILDDTLTAACTNPHTKDIHNVNS
jgi:hypothetical protein